MSVGLQLYGFMCSNKGTAVGVAAAAFQLLGNAYRLWAISTPDMSILTEEHVCESTRWLLERMMYLTLF